MADDSTLLHFPTCSDQIAALEFFSSTRAWGRHTTTSCSCAKPRSRIMICTRVSILLPFGPANSGTSDPTKAHMMQLLTDQVLCVVPPYAEQQELGPLIEIQNTISSNPNEIPSTPMDQDSYTAHPPAQLDSIAVSSLIHLIFSAHYVFLWMKADVSTCPLGARYAIQFTVECARNLQPLALATAIVRMREKYWAVNGVILPELVDFCYFYGDDRVSRTLFYNQSFRRAFKEISAQREAANNPFVSTYSRRWGVRIPLVTWNIHISDAIWTLWHPTDLWKELGIPSTVICKDILVPNKSQTRTIVDPVEGSDLVRTNGDSSEDDH
ncbi:hypothetical protein DFP72DRAFT_861396 [Ephemerocybe angulata]|uniref:Uncharacterized protein n=1 Tax=Ephemerocybe angulata TaxID=980116 RepID=A0A8H6H7H4_9AGAR|nr:hypothetical protein DFP72DRAFT_861396 [Tulosesus angulatus]